MHGVTPASNQILIIDDDELSLEVLKEILSELGYPVLEAATGEAGLRAFRSNRVALVITDFSLPDTTGRDVAKQIKDVDPGIPVILMSGWGASKDWAADPCFDYVLEKPCPFALLSETLGKALAGGRSRAS